MAKKRDLDFTPSEYQEKVFNFIEHGNGNAVISAVAGAGKTTTIVTAMKLVPKNKKCLFIAFNNSIVDELAERLKSYTNCMVKTVHSLGYLMVKRNLGGDISLDEFKYRTYIKANIAELTEQCDTEHMLKPDLNRYIDNITALIDFARFNCAQSAEEIGKIAVRYGVPIMADECKVTEKCLVWGREHTETVDFTDMVWLPYELSLLPMGLQFDWIFADEVQDFSQLSVEMFKRCFKRGTRFVAVGDKNQMINLFAGSSEEAFDDLCNYPNTTVFQLPITYRCAKNIVRVANAFSPETTAREDAPDGQVVSDCHIRDFRAGDMVLARSRTPIIKVYTRLLKMGVASYIKGGEIGRDMLRLIDEVPDEITELNRDLMNDGVFVRLYDNMLEIRNGLMRKFGLDIDDATLSSYVMSVYDTISSLDTLAIGCKTRDELVGKINHIFDEDEEGICLSTVHKAKGLEAECVFILCNSTMPSSLAKQEWEKLQERNLQYVAYTRPRTLLGFVSEKEVPPSASMVEPSAIINDVRHIEGMVCRTLGKVPAKDIPPAEVSRLRLKNATELTQTSKSLQNTSDNPFGDESTGNSLLDELLNLEEQSATHE